MRPLFQAVQKTFQIFLPEINTVLNSIRLIRKEFLDALQSLKNVKCPGFDEFHVNVIKSVYNEIKVPLMHVLRNSVDSGSFLEKNENCQGCTNLQSG